ncbi:peptidase M50B-like protein [Prauserella shujinwangii]|uniref:Peptidase M50B-like protein n=1 Tax=Prauserella shujinwangii TaxID=1453103 RepID=A0A2T0LZ89_9PSEU|nr:M50 family metallopeptidase [Prauserella shujinwangii]PRX49419.1 peptidase M50B-like protein [Prauserella shujinwangii]
MGWSGDDSGIWRLFDLQPGAAGTIVVVAGVGALAAVLLASPWRIARNVVTIVHEAGHAIVALLVGRRLRGIRLHSDTSGVTVSRGKPEGPGMVLTTLAGYPAPALLGLLFAGLVSADRMPVVLTIAGALLLGVLVMVRNAYGVFAVLLSAAVLFVVAFVAEAVPQAVFVYLMTWFLLFGGVRPVFELQAKRRRGVARDSDADQLARLTGLPAVLWVLVLAVLTVSCLVVGGMLLIEPAVR